MALSKLAVRRLTKLADFMDSLPADRAHGFDMRTFREQTKCGTVACALGWATTIPSFRRAGMTAHGWPMDWDEAEFFDTPNAYEVLFSMFFHRTIKTPKQWATHCRKFIAQNS